MGRLGSIIRGAGYLRHVSLGLADAVYAAAALTLATEYRLEYATVAAELRRRAA